MLSVVHIDRQGRFGRRSCVGTHKKMDSKAGKEVGGEEGGKGTYEIQYAQTHHGLMSAAKQSRPSSLWTRRIRGELECPVKTRRRQLHALRPYMSEGGHVARILQTIAHL
jgi:hypothetical protein